MSAQTQQKGLARMTTALIGLSWWLQWGTGTGATSSANAVTTTTTTEARVSATPAQATVTSTNDTLTLTGTITAAGSRAITEVGAFDAVGTGTPPTGGNMDLYGSFSVINLNASDSIAFTINVTYT